MELLRLLNWPLKLVVLLVVAIARAVSARDSPRMQPCTSCGTERLFCIRQTCCPDCEH
jgi:hypothetical protein